MKAILLLFIPFLFLSCALPPDREPYADCRKTHALDFCNWWDAPQKNAFGSSEAGYRDR
ncbi:hypothetical protein OQH61_03530 [Helicobacter sp. MIT 21-1697]|uniref:hypothetical protein n=1 Tax=Helicobacter sp. MIT 21-1697 TaxID=2993733 RepID=UPI00224B4B92|nr:hypothetical protein [Helicobacter sp. MIT 21-1697]MCX2716805.1 hypothetical protein [Helicobacter sp. MIT 21-1697]